MGNVVPFPKQDSSPELRYALSCALLLLDYSLFETRKIIEKCPPGKAKDDFEQQLTALRILLEVARAGASRALALQQRRTTSALRIAPTQK